MDWVYYFCIDLVALEKQWNSPISNIRKSLMESVFPDQAEHWAALDRKVISQAFLPQVNYLLDKYGQDTPPVEAFTSICEKMDVDKGGYTVASDRATKLNQWSKASKEEAWILLDDFYRYFDLFKGLFLLDRQGPANVPLSVLIVNSYLPDYLKYFTPIKNHRRYDGDNRKNYVREIKPAGVEKIPRLTWEIYHLNHLCDFPVLMDSIKWEEQWQALDKLPQFWESFTITETGPTPEAADDLELTIRFLQKKPFKERRRDRCELIQNYMEKRLPKLEKPTTPTYSRFAAEQLKKIGELATYARQNKLDLIEYYI